MQTILKQHTQVIRYKRDNREMVQQENKDKEEFLDEPVEDNDESVEFLDDEFEEDVDSE